MNMASSSNDQVCKYFASSSGEGCKYGEMCKFSHDVTSGQVNGVVRTQQPEEEGSKKDTAKFMMICRLTTRWGQDDSVEKNKE